MAKSITKPKNVIPTVVILDPAANRSVSRIQESYSVQKTSESSVEVINGQEIPVATDEQIQEIIDGYRPNNTSTTVNDEAAQEIINGGSNGSSSSSSGEEFDESNMVSATDEQIWDIINNYGK